MGGQRKDESRDGGGGRAVCWSAAGATHCDGLDAGAAGKSGAAGDRPGLSAPFPQHAPADQYQISLWPKPEKTEQGFFLQLEELEKARQSVPAMEIDLLEYDAQQNTLTLSVSAQNQPALQAFVNQTSENFDFTLQPVSTTEPYTAMIAGKHK